MIDWNGNGRLDPVDVGISIAAENQEHTETIDILGYPFQFVQELEPERNFRGEFKQYHPQTSYKKQQSSGLHKYGQGPFCHFSITAKPYSFVSGVYALFDSEQLLYVGQTVNFAQRFNVGYGNISPRNCYVGGQSTNCKINAMVLQKYLDGEKVYLYFLKTRNYDQIEHELINHLKPPYNESDIPSLVTSQAKSGGFWKRITAAANPAQQKKKDVGHMESIFENTYNEQKIWGDLISEFSKNPRDVKTVPLVQREPKWFYVSASNDNLYIERGRNHSNKSNISNGRALNKLELERMLDLYHRRKRGEAVSAQATQTTMNQVYWYGIFSEMNL
ncbi:hypothetical protein SDC9_51876 [bioreactor metagenome]|uniref:GIY-YIG domain-containing protein n=1 Tax=bioreactor metagenome TaxID=1076179 RepID=A0A644WNU5_9ZZZZ